MTGCKWSLKSELYIKTGVAIRYNHSTGVLCLVHQIIKLFAGNRETNHLYGIILIKQSRAISMKDKLFIC